MEGVSAKSTAYYELARILRAQGVPVQGCGVQGHLGIQYGFPGDCLTSRHCTSFTVWGYTDTYSWVPGVFTGQGAATLLDEASRPSPRTRRYGTGSRPVGERSAGRDGRAVRWVEAPVEERGPGAVARVQVEVGPAAAGQADRP